MERHSFCVAFLWLNETTVTVSLSPSLDYLFTSFLQNPSLIFFPVQNSKLSLLHEPPLRLPDSLTLTRQQRFKPLKDSLLYKIKRQRSPSLPPSLW